MTLVGGYKGGGGKAKALSHHLGSIMLFMSRNHLVLISCVVLHQCRACMCMAGAWVLDLLCVSWSATEHERGG